MTGAIVFDCVSVQFGPYTAVADTSLHVADGEFVSIVGPTGCGKSTLLNIAAGLLEPTTGDISIYGQPLLGTNRAAGYLFQQDALMPWRSALRNVTAGLEYRRVPSLEARRLGNEWLDRVGLHGHGHRLPHQMSGGMRKRVALAQTFINGPEVLLMDEPFSALDVQTRELMQEELLGLWEANRAAVLFVTHDLDEAILLADRVAVLTARPARVKSLHVIDIPRPRPVAELRYDPRFIAIARRFSDELREEVMRARAMVPA